MDLKILGVILMYYFLMSSFFLLGGSYLTDGGASFNSNLNTANISSSELDKGGFFGTGIDFARFAGLVTIGVGLPSNTPAVFQVIFIIVQSAILLFTVGFVVSAIWNG